MIDIHGRRPVGFAPKRAQEWIETELDSDQTEELAVNGCQPTEKFEWYAVSTEVGM